MKSNSDLKDTENVPMIENIDDYFKREVLPFASNAWYDKTKMKLGYEIAFNKYFYKYEKVRGLDEISKDILDLEAETDGLLKEIVEQMKNPKIFQSSLIKQEKNPKKK